MYTLADWTWLPLLAAIAGCHCGVPWLDAIAGAIAARHCEKPLREKIDQSVTPFSAALFSALITHKNWLGLSGVYAGIILVLCKGENELEWVSVACSNMEGRE